MPTCPRGHSSADDEFCDVCGLAFEPDAAAGPAASAASAASSVSSSASSPGFAVPEPVAEAEPAAGRPCPACGAQLAGRFCENCGSDSLAAPPPVHVVSTGPKPPEPPEPPKPKTWSVVVAADERYFRAVKSDGGPDAGEIQFPQFCPERRFPLSGRQVSIGRRSHTRGIAPEIDLTGPPEDIGVSRLHALFVPTADGWSIVDMKSANGTYVNYSREPLRPDEPRPLVAGDKVHLGAWTTLTLYAD